MCKYHCTFDFSLPGHRRHNIHLDPHPRPHSFYRYCNRRRRQTCTGQNLAVKLRRECDCCVSSGGVALPHMAPNSTFLIAVRKLDRTSPSQEPSSHTYCGYATLRRNKSYSISWLFVLRVCYMVARRLWPHQERPSPSSGLKLAGDACHGEPS